MVTAQTKDGTRSPSPPTVGRRVRALIGEAHELRGAARAVLADHAAAVEAVRAALASLRTALAAAELETIPIARLRDVTGGRLRIGALERAGYTSVRAVHDADRYTLRAIPGVGALTADQALSAASSIARAVGDALPVRIDVDAPDRHTTALLLALHPLVCAGPDATRAVDAAARLDRELGDLPERARPATGRLRMAVAGFRGHADETASVVTRLHALVADAAAGGLPLSFAQASADLLRLPVSDIEAWTDFQWRPAEYHSVLDGIGEQGPGPSAVTGSLPEDIAARVAAHPLDDTLRRVSLRGYQAFGARFALAQRRVLLGDEMGLGKTVQAIAAMAHLAARGRTHFLVVCPAGVLLNWGREVSARSALRAVPVHGPDRREAFGHWAAAGGVAITTFDVLHTLTPPGPSGPPPPDMVVVDEAHHVKNPRTRRAHAVAAWTASAGHVLFLTGTPLENRVEEFRALLRHLRPELVDGAGAAAPGPEAFRAAIAPAYLRRNRRDVLAELPPVIHSDEWVAFGPEDSAAYAAAVTRGDFMAMRRAGYTPGTGAKLARLRELVADAATDGRKVVVFSYFLDVLTTVQQALEGAVHGPLTGALSPARRQAMLEDFAATPGPAVLLAQIRTGGTGLNLQTASVVVICEPQVTPMMEHQAVARAHRMGQLRAVRVHRLLSPDGVDQRLLGLLARKDGLFDTYARRSDVADAARDATDTVDTAGATDITNTADTANLPLLRLLVDAERHRLGDAARDVPGAVPDGA